MRALVLSCVVSSASLAAPCPTRSYWPTTDWSSIASSVATTKAAQVQALEQYAFTLTGTDDQRLGIRTDSVIVVHGGQIIYEKYARGWGPTNRHFLWSVSKSITNALAGIAVGQGQLSLTDSICQHLPDTPNTHCTVTVQNLLEFTSGTKWNEDYEGSSASYQASSVLAMLYGVGHKDMAGFVASQPLSSTPGTTFAYSTGETTLLAAVVQGSMAASFPPTWPWDFLFTPIGVTSAVFERDPKGHFVGGAYAYATPRDLAKFGYLFLNDGCWETGRILPDGWVSSSIAPNAVSQGQQGRQWWTNYTPTPRWPDAPRDAYAALGHWGQYILIVPSLDLIVVRTGDDRNGGIDENQLLKLAIAVAQ